LTIDDFSGVIKQSFDFLMSIKIFNIPLLAYFIIVGFLGVIGAFIKGKKE
jgi:hypothetical protein